MQVLGWVHSLDNVGSAAAGDVTSQPRLGVVSHSESRARRVLSRCHVLL